MTSSGTSPKLCLVDTHGYGSKVGRNGQGGLEAKHTMASFGTHFVEFDNFVTFSTQQVRQKRWSQRNETIGSATTSWWEDLPSWMVAPAVLGPIQHRCKNPVLQY